MYRKFQQLLLTIVIIALSGTTTSAFAGPFRMLVESNNDSDAGSEVFQVSFADFDGVLNATFLDSGFTDINIGPQFSIAGLAYDGAYRMLVESNDDRDGGSEVFAATYDSYDDLIAGNIDDGAFTQLNIGPNFSIGGLAYDGNFRMLVESNEDRPAGSEVFAISYESFDDLLSATFMSGGFSAINIGPVFDIGGFVFDGAYRMLLESNDDRAAGSEVFQASFANFDEVLTSTFLSTGFTDLNIGPNFGVRGFAYEPDVLVAVPEVRAASLMGLAFAVLLMLRLRSPCPQANGGVRRPFDLRGLMFS